MAGSILTLYCDDPIQSGSSAGLLDTAQPAAGTIVTGWRPGKASAGRTSLMSYNLEVAAGAFLTTPVQPANPPANAAADTWRLSSATTGDFSTGTWYSSLSVIAVTLASGQGGRARFRFWRSANADGTTATEITAGTMVGSRVTNLLTTVAQSSSASTRIAAFSLANEYLFMQCAWEVTVASGGNNSDADVRAGPITDLNNGSFLVTSAFSTTGGGGGGGAVFGTGYFNQHHYRGLVEGNI